MPQKSQHCNKHLKTIVNEYNKRTGSQVIIKKGKQHTKAFEENGNEITKAEIINISVSQNKTMSSQALIILNHSINQVINWKMIYSFS